MDWTLILIMVLFIILIYMNYKKIIRKTYLRKPNIQGIGKKVRWNLEKASKEFVHQNPSIDFFNESSNTNGVIVEGNKVSSDVIQYLNKQNESYSSKLYSVNPVKAWIGEDPDMLPNKNNYTAHEIIGTEDANTRIQDYRDNPNNYTGSTVGEVYDNMVDNFRVKWGKFEGLEAFDDSSYYLLEDKPSTHGYTEFATY